MKKIILGLFLFALCGTAAAQQAGTVTISWTNADQNVDGSTIPSADHGSLAFSTVKYSVCVNGSVDLDNAKIHHVPATKTSTTIAIEGPAGDYCFAATHTNSFGLESDLSGIVIHTTGIDGQPREFTTPKTPTTLVTQDPNVYTIIKREDRFVLTPVGTVPPNTECLPDQVINNHHAVPREAVTFTGTVKPDIVVAKCF